MFAKVLDLIAAIKAGDYMKAVKLILAFLTDAVDSLPAPAPPKVGKTSSAVLANKTTEELVAELEACCATQKVAAGDAIQAGGAFISIILPILLELLRRFLPV